MRTMIVREGIVITLNQEKNLWNVYTEDESWQIAMIDVGAVLVGEDKNGNGKYYTLELDQIVILPE